MTSQEMLDLTGLTFTIASADTECQEAIYCRWQGYKKYGYAPAECSDSYDDYAYIYISKDEKGAVIGTLRSISRRVGPIDIDKYLNLAPWEDQKVLAELSRFSVPLSARSEAIKAGLWKLAYLHSLETNHTHFVIATARAARRQYEFLGFQNIPLAINSFNYPWLANKLSFVMFLELATAAERYETTGHPLYQFFVSEKHDNFHF